MTENVTMKLSSLVKRIKHGADHNVFQRNGFAMAILIVLMELMRTSLYIIVQHLSLAVKINSLVKMGVVLTKAGSVITIMIVAMDQMKESSVTLNTKHAHHKSLLVRISSASETNTGNSSSLGLIEFY